MSKFCVACGIQLKDDAKFCTGCGAAVTTEELLKEPKQNLVKNDISEEVPSIIKEKTPKTVKQLLNTSFAPVTAGETTLSQELFPLSMPEIANVFGVIGSGIKRILGGFTAAFRDKKQLIPALVLGALWVLLIFLPIVGIDSAPVKFLSWLTFAQGGLNGGIISQIGGILGKGLLAALFTSLIIDKSTLGQIKVGISTLTGGLKGDKITLASWLLGMALALILYNLMVGSTSLQNSMAAIACLGLSLRGLANGGGFAWQFFTSLLYKKSASTTGIQRFMAGWAAGFALALVVSVLPGGINGYILGGILFIAAGIAKLIGGKSEEVTVQ
ncbi:MAG: zinc ribbon domain-containing protein [Syntrophomonadaceae bacterium]|nr:zinc ribbon domain-containing protein [Syntrophomonadaceae bacterium]